jgi:hypothetical protein
LPRWKADEAGPLQFQQQRACGHVFELALRVAPVPAAAPFLAPRRSPSRDGRPASSAHGSVRYPRRSPRALAQP